MSKFCSKCSSRLHELFGLCPNCNANEFQHELADEIAGAKREPISKISTSEKELEERQKVKPEMEDRGKMAQNHTARFPALKAILILLALGILFAGTIGGFIYCDLVSMPLVKNILRNSTSRNAAMQGQYELYSEVNNQAVKLEEKYAIDGFITIPNGCTVIGNSAFNWCESLEVITLPATITEIQWNAFAHCVNLSDIYFAGTMEQWQSINISHTGNEELLSATIHYNSSGPSN